ncbi:MAG: putative glycoside hydrolase [Vicinamibacterales bacterium]
MPTPSGPRLLNAALLVTVALGLVTAATPHAARTREFPDTSSRIAILTDQFSGPNADQIRFAATHFVGSQKLSLDESRALRRINPNFIVLHYKLAIWQSAPNVPYIVDGTHWSNDFPEVNKHESWFWHTPDGRRVASDKDRKLLMNIADPGFRQYWKDVLVRQVEAGEYDGVFFDSASPALLTFEARNPVDPRLMGRGARQNLLPELGNRSWTTAWADWMIDLDAHMSRRGIPVIPNVGALVTTWDNTDYSVAAGAFLEQFSEPGFDPSDWVDATNKTLSLVGKNRIVILQNYLQSPGEVARRKYLLANYLLVKGSRTYLSYFANNNTMDWYPEWELDLGAARSLATSVSDLAWQGVYRRDFAKGVVLVNPTSSSADVKFDAPLKRVDPVGGGPLDNRARPQGSFTTTVVTGLTMPARTAEVFLR